MSQRRLHLDYIQENFLPPPKKYITNCKILAFIVYCPQPGMNSALSYIRGKNLQQGLCRSVTVTFFLVFYFVYVYSTKFGSFWKS